MRMVDSQVRKRIRIEGRVQGVGFRWFARTAARDCGVVGWVKNQSDGSVLCEAQGSAAAVDAFARAVAAGPRFSRVERVSVDDAEPTAADLGFEIAS
jgi:acylphosphatase